MQDRPTAPELLDAVAAMLVTQVREWVPREHRFQVLVAANVCAVVARELRAGAEPDASDLALFQELGGAGDEPRAAAGDLARRIRVGELDDRLDEAVVRLREHVARKLEVARPGYAAAPHPPNVPDAPA